MAWNDSVKMALACSLIVACVAVFVVAMGGGGPGAESFSQLLAIFAFSAVLSFLFGLGLLGPFKVRTKIIALVIFGILFITHVMFFAR